MSDLEKKLPLKVGTKIKVINKLEHGDHETGDYCYFYWNPDMDSLYGRVFEIKSLSGYAGGCYEIYDETTSNHWSLLPSLVQPVNPQLLFDFMNNN